MKTKFLVFADLHVDIMHDSVARVERMARAALNHQVDFILHLGDIMYPEAEYLREFAPESLKKRLNGAWFVCDRDDEKIAIRRLLEQTGLPVYGVLGNHDMDSCDKATVCRYWGMPAPYYDFVRGGVRFLVLDGNFIQSDDGLIDFDHCNYRLHKMRETSFIPPEQLQWLRRSVLSSREPCVLLSHAPLGDDMLNIHNMADVWRIIDEANAHTRRVVLAMNGHNHADGLCARHGVPFLSINSASNLWLGMEYQAVRYSETIVRHYPFIRGCAPYLEPLYAIVTIDEAGITVTGTESSFVGPTPQQLGFPQSRYFHEPVACISSRLIPLTPLAGDGIVRP